MSNEEQVDMTEKVELTREENRMLLKIPPERNSETGKTTTVKEMYEATNWVQVVLPSLVKKGLVTAEVDADKGRTCYQLTELGSKMREALDQKQNPDMVNPPHYKVGGIETMDVIDSWGFGFIECLANTIRYVARADHKGDKLLDLRKAEWYLNHAIEWMTLNDMIELPIAPFRVFGGGPFDAVKVTQQWELSADLRYAIQHIAHFGSDPQRDVLENAMYNLQRGIEEVQAEQ